jgi:hypothetical protein
MALETTPRHGGQRADHGRSCMGQMYAFFFLSFFFVNNQSIIINLGIKNKIVMTKKGRGCENGPRRCVFASFGPNVRLF